MIPFRRIPPAPGGPPLLIVADHASNAVPPGVHLGVSPKDMLGHIAVDIGAGPLAMALAALLGAEAFIATISRLVVDLNREPDAPGLIPVISDGIAIPGNVALSSAQRAQRLAWHSVYHEQLAALIAARRPALIISVHSFTPQLASRPEEARPWPLGILYNNDDRAARPALAWAEGHGILAGDNLPYSGRDLNYTMNCHAEANDIVYLGLEVRQDEIGTSAGVARWAEQLAAMVGAVAGALA